MVYRLKLNCKLNDVCQYISYLSISAITYRTVTKIPGIGDTIVKMFLYSEKEVEMRAWEKYGGPEGFERM